MCSAVERRLLRVDGQDEIEHDSFNNDVIVLLNQFCVGHKITFFLKKLTFLKLDRYYL